MANGAGVALVLTVLLGHGLPPGSADERRRDSRRAGDDVLLLSFGRRRRLTNARLLLVGVALGTCSALMTWAVYFSTGLDLRMLMC